jgi:hypothetical protein
MNGPQTNFGQPGAHPQPSAHPPVPGTVQPVRTIPPMAIPQRINPAPPIAPIAPAAPKLAKPVEDEPLSLVAEETGLADPAKSKIRAFSIAEAHIGAHDWKRTPREHHAGACRVRSFHGRLSDQGIEYLDNAINEWLDKHPEADVKFVTSTVGMFDGKIKDLALVLNLWY